MYIYQNLIENTQIFVSGFFPEFPDPVFSRKKTVRGLAGGQTMHQNAMFKHLSTSVPPFTWWQKVADMKNAKN